MIPATILIPNANNSPNPLVTLSQFVVCGTGLGECLLAYSNRDQVLLISGSPGDVLHFTVLALRLIIAPQVFMKMTKLLAYALSQLYVELFLYLSDCLIQVLDCCLYEGHRDPLHPETDSRLAQSGMGFLDQYLSPVIGQLPSGALQGALRPSGMQPHVAVIESTQLFHSL